MENHTQTLNTMFRDSNKIVYEIEAQINDLYYGRPIKMNVSNRSNGQRNDNLHSFGYGVSNSRESNDLGECQAYVL